MSAANHCFASGVAGSHAPPRAPGGAVPRGGGLSPRMGAHTCLSRVRESRSARKGPSQAPTGALAKGTLMLLAKGGCCCALAQAPQHAPRTALSRLQVHIRRGGHSTASLRGGHAKARGNVAAGAPTARMQRGRGRASRAVTPHTGSANDARDPDHPPCAPRMLGGSRGTMLHRIAGPLAPLTAYAAFPCPAFCLVPGRAAPPTERPAAPPRLPRNRSYARVTHRRNQRHVRPRTPHSAARATTGPPWWASAWPPLVRWWPPPPRWRTLLLLVA